jgi:hypothetical protein
VNIVCLPVEKTVHRAWLRKPVAREAFDLFREGLKRLFDRIDQGESEEHLKRIVADFLTEGWYRDVGEINTKERADLVIHAGRSSRDPVAVIIEMKHPANAAEMISAARPNAKALHELILYYLRERIAGNLGLTRLIACNIYEWYIFDAADFDRYFYSDKGLVRQFRDWEGNRLSSARTDAFYGEIVRPFLERSGIELVCTHIDLRPCEALVRNPAGGGDGKLLPLFKLFSPPHLLKLPFANDSNTLNREFYNELLHIIGLEEIREGGRKLIGRKPDGKRDEGALLENAINVLKVRGCLPAAETTTPESEGDADERIFSAALELCITWINRVLFLKLLEGRLVAWNGGDNRHAFLRPDALQNFDGLEELFFEVLAVRPEERRGSVAEKFRFVPYLNSSLFEETDLERETVHIADLKGRLELPLYGGTVLKDETGKRREGFLSAPAYLLRFLDAYDFSGEGTGGVREMPRTIINASVLGLIFEKINGYREGSIFTPGFITMYICRGTLRRAVVEKFRTNMPGMKKIRTFADLKERLDPADPEARKTANALIDNLTVCDLAVGSGHFLVSALNEIIAVKGELGILCYRDGARIKEYAVGVENDELFVTDRDDEKPFAYRLNKNGRPIEPLQRLQEALFHEKRTLIEQGLFGVDINPKSVAICRLRLWIELLKHAYYTKESGYARLETLPNIDINIKCGNSLISRFALAGGDDVLPTDRARLKVLAGRYRGKVLLYKLHPANKAILRREIENMKEELQAFSLPTDAEEKLLRKLENDIAQTLFDFDREGAEKRTRIQERAGELRRRIDEKKRTVYRAAFEWRYEFPEVLDENGRFVGFDCVIGNPPYVRQGMLGAAFTAYARSRYEVYHGFADLYAYFFELGVAVLREGGYFSIIVANKWMRANYGAPLRKWLREQGLELVVDFGALPVFPEATAYPCIVRLRKGSKRKSFTACNVKRLADLDIEALVRTEGMEVAFSSLTDSGWTLTGGAEQRLLEKLRKTGTPLGEYVGGKIYRGILTGLNEAFVIDAATRERLIAQDPKSAEIIKPFLLGRDVKRYRPLLNKHYLIFTRRDVDIKAYPAIEEYLGRFKEQLTPKPKDGTGGSGPGRKPGAYQWYEIQDTVDYWKEFEKPKIIIPAIVQKGSYAFDAEGFYSNDKTTIIAMDDLYLLGLLNSKVTDFVIHAISSTKQGGYYEYKPMYLVQIPIRAIDFAVPEEKARHDRIVALVERMLRLHKEPPEPAPPEENENRLREITATDAEIDSLVCDLYGLTVEEIRILEESGRTTDG